MTKKEEEPMASEAQATSSDPSGTDEYSSFQGTGFSLNRILSLSKPEWRTLLVGSIFLLIGSGMGLLYPQGIRIVIDSLNSAKGESVINQAALLLVLVFVVQGVAVALRSYLFTVAGERIVTKLRQTLYRHLIDQEVGFFDSRRTGELLNRLSSDTTVLQNTVSVNVSMALRNVFTVIGGVALLFLTSFQLTLLTLAIVPPVALGAVFFGRKIRKLSRDAQDALARASEIAEETLSGIRTVRAFAREDQEGARYEAAVEESFEVARKRAFAVSIFSGVVSFAAFSAIAIVIWYGGHLVFQKQMSVGVLTSFLLYTLLVAVSLGALAGLWADFMRASGAGQRVFELLDRITTIPPEEGKTLDKIEGHIAFEGVSFRYPTRPDVPVLEEIELSLAPGEVVALVGPSGSGKSTIASLIPRFYDPDKGSIQIDQTPLTELNATWLREQVGIVSQEPILFSTSIIENIRYGRPTATMEEIEAAAKSANAHDFILEFPEGYETQVGERGVQLSGGQKQRVAIARALLKDPKILILDEATSALDSESEHLVKQALDRLMEGRTTLVIAHRLSTVKDANRVLVINQGKIEQAGSHDELMEEEGLYHRLVERQFVGH